MDAIRQRSEISEKDKWNLSAIYESEEKWEEDFMRLSLDAEKLSGYAGKLKEEESILACLRLDDELGELFGELYVYAHQRRDEDAGVEKYCAMCDRIDTLGVKLSEKGSFILPELTALKREELLAMAEKAEFSDFDYMLKEVVRRKEHTL